MDLALLVIPAEAGSALQQRSWSSSGVACLKQKSLDTRLTSFAVENRGDDEQGQKQELAGTVVKRFPPSPGASKPAEAQYTKRIAPKIRLLIRRITPSANAPHAIVA